MLDVRNTAQSLVLDVRNTAQNLAEKQTEKYWDFVAMLRERA